ncbi:MAG TPA: TRAP transporter substrate-binding protein DctP [Xanthobacteraceae bacterium]|nr:TRAP transporter substrate-binding protein DctP [Xanthobacteraceae bacterium]
MNALVRLTGLVLAAGIAMTASAAAQKIQLRFSTAAPPPDFLSKSLERFKEEVDKAAPDQFDIKLHPGSSLFRQGTEVPAIQRGNLEMSTMTTFEVAQQIPEWGFFNRAFLFRDWDHVAKVMSGPIGERYKKDVADKMGIVILAPTYLGTRQLNLRVKRDVKGPADLAGVKLRMTGGPEWLLLGEALGVTPTPMAMPEVYLSLKTGSIDGQENPLTIMNAAKFYEVTEQVVLTAHLVQPVFYSLRKQTWDALSAAQKKVVQDAAAAATKQNNEARLNDEKQVAERLKAQGLTITAVDMKPFHDKADQVYGASDFAKAWNKELMAQAVAVK